MWSLHRLRPKLFIVMVGGSLLLTVFLTIVTVFSQASVRNKTLATARQGIEQQGAVYLELLVDMSALFSAEQFNAAADAASVAARAVETVARQPRTSIYPLSFHQLRLLAGGAQTDVRPERITSILIPPDADMDGVKRDLAISSVLESLLPHQREAAENIQYTAYVGRSGTVRVYPALDLTARKLEMEAELLAHFRASGEREQAILPAFLIPGTLGALGLSSAIVRPIYTDAGFQGLIIVYVSLAEINNALTELRVTPDSYGFLIDERRTLVAAPLEAQRHLLERAPQPLDDTYTIDQTVSEELDRAIAAMESGETGVRRIRVEERPYVIAYTQLPRTSWSLGLVAPVDELARELEAISGEIRSTNRQAQLLSLVSALAFVALVAAASLYLSDRLTRPISRLADAARAISRGDYEQQVAIDSRDEVGDVAHAFNTMSESIRHSHQQLEDTVRARTEALSRTVEDLEQALAQRADLQEQLRNASTPVIPVAQGVLLLPLIGSVDEQRAQQSMQFLLDMIEEQQARTAVIDVTGLPVIDTTVAAMLLRAAQAARLLGAEVIVTGIRPEVAETLVALGIGLEQLQAMGNLQSAMLFAFRHTS